MSTAQKTWWYGVQLPNRVLEEFTQGCESPPFTCKKKIGGKEVVIYCADDDDRPVRAFIGRLSHRRGRRNYVLQNPKEVPQNQLRELDIHRV